MFDIDIKKIIPLPFFINVYGDENKLYYLLTTAISFIMCPIS